MSTVLPNHVIVTANLPGYEGPFVIEVPTLDPDSPRVRQSAMHRAMFALMAAGHFDPPAGMSPDQTIAEFFSADYR